jgi:hypothetical protein
MMVAPFGLRHGHWKIQMSTAFMGSYSGCRGERRGGFRYARLYSCHSFRVTTITDLLEKNVPREGVQHLAGDADARTTGLYDRRRKKIGRKIVEGISV